MGHLPEIRLESNGYSAVVVPERGGTVTQLEFEGEKVFYCNQETVDDLDGHMRFGMPDLFPNAGSTDVNTPGARFDLPQHGFPRKEKWDVLEASESSVMLTVASNENSMSKYPYPYRLTKNVSLTDNGFVQELAVENTGVELMPVCPGEHPYFFNPHNEMGSLTTNINSFDPSKIDWIRDWEYDQNGKNQTLFFRNPGVVVIRRENLVITMDAPTKDFKTLAIWSEPSADFVCIEPWGNYPNAINSKDGATLIRPGETRIFKVEISAKKVTR